MSKGALIHSANVCALRGEELQTNNPLAQMIQKDNEEYQIGKASRSQNGNFLYGPIYHFSAKVVSRGKGQSAVASAAYRAGAELVDERTGEVKDFTRKERVDFSEIAAPENAPEWVRDRQRLWNEVESGEKRKDAQLCREVNAALPKALTLDEQKNIVREFVAENYTKRGMVTDWNIHDSQGKNPHVHMMITMREIGPEGFAKKKNRDWNRKEFLEQQREGWAKTTNKELNRVGFDYRIDHRSLEAQGIDRIPQKHLGPRPNIYQKAEHSQIIQANKELAQLTKDLKEIQARQKEIHGKAAELQEQQQERTQEPQRVQAKERAAEPVREPQNPKQPERKAPTKKKALQIKQPELDPRREALRQKVEARQRANDNEQKRLSNKGREVWPEHEREQWRMEERPKIKEKELHKMIEERKAQSKYNKPIQEHEAKAKAHEDEAKRQSRTAEAEKQSRMSRLLGKDKRAERAAEEARRKAEIEKGQANKLTEIRDKHVTEAVKAKLAADPIAKKAFESTVEKQLKKTEQIKEKKIGMNVDRSEKLERQRKAREEKAAEKKREKKMLEAMTLPERQAWFKEKRKKERGQDKERIRSRSRGR